MGQPNNQAQDSPDVVFQDSRSLLDFILGKLTVPRGAILAGEWMEIIEAVTHGCKPHLKYMPSFSTLRDLLCDKLDPTERHKSSELALALSKTELDPSINIGTLCTTIWQDHRAEGDLGAGLGVRTCIGTEILLSREGEWLLLYFEIDRHNYLPGSVGKMEISGIKMISVKIIDRGSFIQLLRLHTGLGYQVINAFWLLSRRSVEEKEQRLRAAVLLRDTLGAILNRVDCGETQC